MRRLLTIAPQFDVANERCPNCGYGLNKARLGDSGYIGSLFYHDIHCRRCGLQIRYYQRTLRTGIASHRDAKRWQNMARAMAQVERDIDRMHPRPVV